MSAQGRADALAILSRLMAPDEVDRYTAAAKTIARPISADTEVDQYTGIFAAFLLDDLTATEMARLRLPVEWAEVVEEARDTLCDHGLRSADGGP